jgi:ribonuclease Z
VIVGDHSFGLPGMLCLMGQATQAERFNSNEKIDPVEVYGPEGLRDMVRAMLQCSYSRITVPHVIHELKNISQLHSKFVKVPPPPMVRTRQEAVYGEVEGSRDIYPNAEGIYQLFEDEDTVVMAAPLQHTVPCVGYVVQEKARPGKLRMEAVQDLVEKNFDALKNEYPNPMKVYGKLKLLGEGETFTFPDGSVVSASDVMEPSRKGKKVVVMGDNCNGDKIAPICLDADVLVHEATNSWIKEFDGAKYSHPKMLERDTFIHGHSTPSMAGRFAKAIRAKRLLLTHFSPRYRGDDQEGSMKIMWQVEDQARVASELYGYNDVVAAWDLMVYPIPDDNKTN